MTNKKKVYKVKKCYVLMDVLFEGWRRLLLSLYIVKF
jgi:hypothetical protein